MRWHGAVGNSGPRESAAHWRIPGQFQVRQVPGTVRERAVEGQRQVSPGAGSQSGGGSELIQGCPDTGGLCSSCVAEVLTRSSGDLLCLQGRVTVIFDAELLR